MIKLLVFDLDGTLLMENQEIDEETLIAIKKYDDIKYLIATGRSHQLVEDIVSKYNLKCDLILNSGHEFISYDRGIHIVYPFSKENLKNVVDIFLKRNCHLSLHGADGNKYIFTEKELYYNQHIELSGKVRNRSIDELLETPLFSRKAYLKNVVTLKSVDELDDLEIIKIDGKCFRREVAWEVKAKLREIKTINVTTSYGSYMEVAENNMNKGEMLLEVANMYGIYPHEIVAFGDGDNDIDMMNVVPNFFAMANGHEMLKAKARYITETNENQGVLEGLRFILEKENNLKV